MKIASFLRVVVLLFLAADAVAQTSYLEAENTHQISNKSERGYLANVETNDQDQLITLYFVTKVKSKKIKVEGYVFGYDLQFKSTFKDEYDTPEKVKEKYRWFKFGKNDYEKYYGVTADPNMVGTLVFRKREITKYFNWFNGRYQTSVKTLDKLKPKDESGNKYYYRTHFDNLSTGEVLAVTTPKDKDPNVASTNYSVLKVDVDLNIKSNESFNFDKAQYMIYQGAVVSEDANPDLFEGDYAIVFAPLEKGGGVKNVDANGANYTYVRISQDGRIKEKINFTTKSSTWRIEGIYEVDGTVYLYGPGNKMKSPDDAYGSTKNYDPAKMEKNFENFQVVALQNKGVKFVSAPNIDEITAVTVGPDGQKKVKEYNGGRIDITGISIAQNGDILVQGQMKSVNLMSKEIVYKDFLLFQFKPTGELNRLFSIDSPARSGLTAATDPLAAPASYPSTTSVISGQDKNIVYWMTGLVTAVDVTESQAYAGFGYTNVTKTYTPREQLIMSRADLQNGKMESVQILGDNAKGKKDFYLMRELRYVKFEHDSKMLILGEDRNSGFFGKNNYIYLGLMNFRSM